MESEANSSRPSFWKPFFLGTAAALAGNLLGWLVTLALLGGLASDQVVEGFAWLTVLLSWSLVPVFSLGYGILASRSKLRNFQAGKSVSWKMLAVRGIALGVLLWLVLGLLCFLLVTFL